MKFYTVTVDEDEHNLLLKSLGESCDNAPDELSERNFENIFDLVKEAHSFEADDISSEYNVKSKEMIGRAGEAVLKVMRLLAEADAKGKINDVGWYNHELCAMLRGFAAVGWSVLVIPQPDGFFRCVDIEGMRFKV